MARHRPHKDEACFVLFGERMDQNAFRELTSQVSRLYAEVKYADALQIVEEKAVGFPEELARTTFWKMCLLSFCNQPEHLLAGFRLGLDSGLWWAENQFVLESDLDSVRELPEFKRLGAITQKKYLQARAATKPDCALLQPDKLSKSLPLLIALHGRNGNKDSNLEQWETARQRGWLVLSPQSTQPVYPGSYCWDENDQGLKDILFHVEEVLDAYKVDRARIILAGFSQGSGMAIYASLSGKIEARGFISVGTFMAEPDSLIPLAKQKQSLRGYFVTGEKDRTLDKARAIQKILKENSILFAEEIHPNLGHEFPPDFEKSFTNAIRFILE